MRNRGMLRYAASAAAPLLVLALTAGQCNDTGNAPPSLSGIGDQRTPMNEPLEVAFTIQDEDPDGVTIEPSSSDATLVAEGDLEVVGGGADRALRITPAPQGLGGVTITLEARDPEGLEDEASFTLQVARPFSRQIAKLAPDDGADQDFFGGAVALDGDHALVGADFHDGAGPDAGAAYVFERSGDAWTQIAKLTADDAAASDNFGGAVALDGDHALVGADFHDGAGPDAGAAYVFQRSGDAWNQTDKLTASDAADGDNFGGAVALDGDHALIGAQFADEGGADVGGAYVFQRSGDAWNQTDKLTADDAADGDRFGFSVALDEDHALVGAVRHDGAGPDAGAAYAFQRSGNSWNQTSTLTASDAAADDNFGLSAALDGDHALIGAPLHDGAGTDAGAAYVFQRSGGAWNQTNELIADDAADGDDFGIDVALDGDYALIGSFRDDDAGTDAGATYVFQRTGDAWNQINELTADDASDGDGLGSDLALDGDRALIGAFQHDDAGAAYAYLK